MFLGRWEMTSCDHTEMMYFTTFTIYNVNLSICEGKLTLE